MSQTSPSIFNALRHSLGDAAVDTSEETIARYGRNLLPGGDRRPAGVVYPASTADVQTIVRLANQYCVPLYSISTGENSGLGLRSPIRPGCIIVDVGARMSRALHIILFNRQDPEECQRVIACYRALMAAYAQAGYLVSRVPLDFQEEAMARLETFPEVCADIKRALDPNGILSPGRYGIDISSPGSAGVPPASKGD